MNNVFFISGIDTGCGKTYVTGLLAKYLCLSGKKVITQKMIQTGCEGISEDILEHRRIMGCGTLPEDEQGLTCPYVFKFPASPQLASELEKKPIHTRKITETTEILSQKYDIVLIEGAGGLHVPVNEDVLIIDYIKQQGYPVILVSSSKLGSINHTLLSIESCHYHSIKLSAIIYNRLPGSDEMIAQNTFQTIQKVMQGKHPGIVLTELEGMEQSHEILHLFKHINHK